MRAVSGGGPLRGGLPLRCAPGRSPLLRRPNQSPRRRDQSPSEAKRARLSHSAERGPIRPGKENSEGQLPSASTTRFGGESGGCRPAGQQMRPPRKADEGGTALYDGKAQAARKLQLIPAVRSPNPNKHGTDPLYVGLPNYGNSCYQNATLQSLLGLRPFLSEMMSLITDHEGDQCCTRAVAKLNAPTEGPTNPGTSTSCGTYSRTSTRHSAAPRCRTPTSSYCGCWTPSKTRWTPDGRPPTPSETTSVSDRRELHVHQVPRDGAEAAGEHQLVLERAALPGSEPPTLQDALRLSMRPDRRELLCQHCRHTECRVTTKLSQLPRTLILQLNRYVFLEDESGKIRANVGIPKFLSLNEFVGDDVTRPPEWKSTGPSLSSLSEFEEPERPPAPSRRPVSRRPAGGAG